MMDGGKDGSTSRIDGAAVIITRVQAQALADLLWEGKLKGTTLPDVEPPARVALVGIGRAEGFSGALDRTRDGEYVLGEDSMVPVVDEPASHTLGVVADDGRCWSIVRAGICWPVEVAQDVEKREAAR